jgi:hypothetical protein
MKTAAVPHPTSRLDFEPVELSIIMGGRVRLTSSELAGIRQESLSSEGLQQPFGSHDEQTLASLVALADAIENTSLMLMHAHRWAIVSSSWKLGQSTFSAFIKNEFIGGPWNIAVEFIPDRKALAVGGRINLIVKSVASCVGARQGRVEVNACLLAARTFKRMDWFGVWLVFSAWLPNVPYESTSISSAKPSCYAIAVALTRECSAYSLGRVRSSTYRNKQADSSDESRAVLSARFKDFLTEPRNDRTALSSPHGNAVDLNAVYVPRRGSGPEPMRYALFQLVEICASIS